MTGSKYLLYLIFSLELFRSPSETMPLRRVRICHRTWRKSQPQESKSDMTRRTPIIAFIALLFGAAFLAQPAIAAECAKMMRCMHGHSDGHLPSAKEKPFCDCAQSAQKLLRYGCMPQKRSQVAPDINLSSHIDDGMPSPYDSPWLSQDWPWTAHRFFRVVDPAPGSPIFILNQTILC